MRRLVLASNNAKKLKELGTLLAPLGIELVPQEALNIPEAEEPFATFIENALAKARHASQLSGLPAIADDSGLCVRALGGAPGVLSARFAGDPKPDERNNQLLLEKLAGQTDRAAHFVCLLVLVRHADDPQPIIAEGNWHGEILNAPQGEHGFGYDPLFWVLEANRSAAQMTAEAKNQCSHRAMAMQQLLARLNAV